MQSEFLYIFFSSLIGSLLIWKYKIIHLASLGNASTASDTEYHLLLTERIRLNKNNPLSLKDERFVINPNFNYPWFLHWLLSFIKTERLTLNQSKIQILIKTIAIFITSVFSGYIFCSLNVDIKNFQVVFVCIFFYHNLWFFTNK